MRRSVGWAGPSGLGAVLVCLAAGPAAALVQCPSLFSDGAVLQQGGPVPIWGTAAPGEQVTVQLQGQYAAATATDGTWRVTLNPLDPGGPENLVIAGERNTLIIRNVLVGEVWLCAGQSNMAYRLALCEEGAQAVAAAANPNLRLFQVPKDRSNRPRSDVAAGWAPAAPETAADFSGVGWYFGRALQAARRVPVGLIDASFGGTPIEAWMSLAALQRAGYEDILDLHARAATHYAEADRAFRRKLKEWSESAAAARANGGAVPEAPDDALARLPSVLYHAMIRPLQPFALRGVCWYQGESNAPRAWQYRALLSALIGDWREGWRNERLPFLIVQLPGYQGGQPETSWAEVREAQLMVSLTEPDTALVVTCDLGESDNLHPRRKEPVGERLAAAARGLVYGEALDFAGPVYETVEIDGQRARVRFAGATGGLVAKGGPLTGFTIAGADGRFVAARASLEGGTVLVWSPAVPAPVAVRYGWANAPAGNLGNGRGLPASPFRTDDFPTATAPRTTVRGGPAGEPAPTQEAGNGGQQGTAPPAGMRP